MFYFNLDNYLFIVHYLFLLFVFGIIYFTIYLTIQNNNNFFNLSFSGSSGSSGNPEDPEDPEKDKLKKLLLKIKDHLNEYKIYYISAAFVVIISSSCLLNDSCSEYVASFFKSNSELNSPDLDIETSSNSSMENIAPESSNLGQDTTNGHIADVNSIEVNITDVNPTDVNTTDVNTTDLNTTNVNLHNGSTQVRMESNLPDFITESKENEGQFLTYQEEELPQFEYNSNEVQFLSSEEVVLPRFETSEVLLDSFSQAEQSELSLDPILLSPFSLRLSASNLNSETIILDVNLRDGRGIKDIIYQNYKNNMYYYKLFHYDPTLERLPLKEVDEIYKQRFMELESMFNSELPENAQLFLDHIFTELEACSSFEEKNKFIENHFNDLIDCYAINKLNESERNILFFKFIHCYNISFPEIKILCDPRAEFSNIVNLSTVELSEDSPREFRLNFNEDLSLLIKILETYKVSNKLSFELSDIVSILDTFMEYLNSPGDYQRYFCMVKKGV